MSQVLALSLFSSLHHPRARVAVIVAAMDIPVGAKVTNDGVTIRDWRKDMIPEGSITDITDALNKTVKVRLLKGDIIRTGMIQ